MLLCTMTVTMLGCKAPVVPGTVSGKVSLKGKPIPAGEVAFVHIKGTSGASGPVSSDGTYKLADPLPPGVYQVYVVPPPLPAPTPPGMTPTAPATPVIQVDIPPKYQTEATSGLTADVKSGPNTFDFAIP